MNGHIFRRNFFFNEYTKGSFNTREIQNKPSKRSIYTIIRWDQTNISANSKSSKDRVAMEHPRRHPWVTNTSQHQVGSSFIQSIHSTPSQLPEKLCKNAERTCAQLLEECFVVRKQKHMQHQRTREWINRSFAYGVKTPTCSAYSRAQHPNTTGMRKAAKRPNKKDFLAAQKNMQK